MQINFTHNNIELTDAIKDYAQEKFLALKDYFDEIQICDVVLGKTSNHHEKGEVFECKVHLTYPGGSFYVDKVSEDLYKAINECKDVLQRDIRKMKTTRE